MSSRSKKKAPTTREISNAIKLLARVFRTPNSQRERATAWAAHEILVRAGFYPHGWSREDGMWIDHACNADTAAPFEGSSAREDGVANLSLDDLREMFGVEGEP